MEQVTKVHAYAGMGIQLCCHTQLHKRLFCNQILMDKHFAVFKHITTHIQCWSCRNIYSIFLCWKWDTDSSYLTDLPSLPKISSTRTSFLFFLLSSVEPNAATRQCDVSFPKCSFTTSKVQDEWKFRGPSITFSYNI